MNHTPQSCSMDRAADAEVRIATRRQDYAQRAIREQFGQSMLRLAAAHPQLLAVTADLMHATGMAGFGLAFPERLINVGIAEQNMAGVAAGLAACGKLPVACGYAAFTALRALEQARNDAAYNEAKVILAGLSAGLSYGVGGPTHQTFEDVAIMRAIPQMMVVVPSDVVEVDQALEACVQHAGTHPIYLRLGRGPEFVFNDPAQPFEIGRARRLRQGSELCVIANGPVVFEALLACDALAAQGVDATLLNMHTVKPIDADAVRHEAARCRAMLVVEEHSRLGGLGAAVLEVLHQGHGFPVELMGIADIFPPIGPTAELRAALGLDAAHIARRALALLKAAA